MRAHTQLVHHNGQNRAGLLRCRKGRASPSVRRAAGSRSHGAACCVAGSSLRGSGAAWGHCTARRDEHRVGALAARSRLGGPPWTQTVTDRRGYGRLCHRHTIGQGEQLLHLRVQHHLAVRAEAALLVEEEAAARRMAATSPLLEERPSRATLRHHILVSIYMLPGHIPPQLLRQQAGRGQHIDTRLEHIATVQAALQAQLDAGATIYSNFETEEVAL